jgi:hypothetical protein
MHPQGEGPVVVIHSYAAAHEKPGTRSTARMIAARLKKVEDDLAAVVQVYSDPAALLYARGCIIIHHHKM